MKNELSIKVVLNTEEAEKQFVTLQSKFNKMDVKIGATTDKQSVDRANKDISDKIKDKSVKISVDDKELSKLRDKLTDAEVSLKKFEDRAKKMKKADDWSGFEENQKQVNKYKDAVKFAKIEIGEFHKKLNPSILKTYGDNISKVAKRLVMYKLATEGIQAVGNIFKKSVDASLEFETALAGINKTVNATAGELKEIDNQLRELSKTSPVSYTELAKIAEIGGQLGVAKKDLIDFTEVMSQLRATTNLTTDEAVQKFAQFTQTMEVSGGELRSLGNVLVDLGNNSATTESQILTFANRIKASGKLAGLSATDILALGTSVSASGISAEAGGTAINKVLEDITKSVATSSEQMEAYAEVSGMSADVFKTQWKTEPLETFGKFLENLREQGDGAFTTLDDLGLKNVRTTRTLLTTATAGFELTDSIERTNIALKNNNALQVEFDKRAGTNASTLEMQKNRWLDIASSIGDVLVPALIWLNEVALDTVEWLTGSGKAFGILLGAITSILAVLGTLSLSITVLGGVFAGLTGAVGLLSGGIKILGLTIYALPIIGWIAAIGTATAAIYTWRKEIKELLDKFDMFNGKMTTTKAIIGLLTLPIQMLIKTFKLLGDLLGWAGEQMGFFGDESDNVSEKAEKQADRIKELNKEQERLNKRLEEGKITQKEYADSTKSITDEIYNLSDANGKAIIEQERHNEAMQNAIEEIDNYKVRLEELKDREEKLTYARDTGKISQDEYLQATKENDLAIQNLNTSHGVVQTALDITNNKQLNYKQKMQEINKLHFQTGEYDKLIKVLADIQAEGIKAIRIQQQVLRSKIAGAKADVFGGGTEYQQQSSMYDSEEITKYKADLLLLEQQEKQLLDIEKEALKIRKETNNVIPTTTATTGLGGSGGKSAYQKQLEDDKKARDKADKQAISDAKDRSKALLEIDKELNKEKDISTINGNKFIISVLEDRLEDTKKLIEKSNGDELKSNIELSKDIIKDLQGRYKSLGDKIKEHNKNVDKGIDLIQDYYDSIVDGAEDARDSIGDIQDDIDKLNDSLKDKDTKIADRNLEIQKEILDYEKELRKEKKEAGEEEKELLKKREEYLNNIDYYEQKITEEDETTSESTKTTNRKNLENNQNKLADLENTSIGKTIELEQQLKELREEKALNDKIVNKQILEEVDAYDKLNETQKIQKDFQDEQAELLKEINGEEGTATTIEEALIEKKQELSLETEKLSKLTEIQGTLEQNLTGIISVETKKRIKDVQDYKKEVEDLIAKLKEADIYNSSDLQKVDENGNTVSNVTQNITYNVQEATDAKAVAKIIGKQQELSEVYLTSNT